MKSIGFALAMTLGGAGHAAAPLIGPWPVADPSEVMVLGTPHLSGIEKLDPAWLAPLLDRLAAWKPALITIEGLSGPECFLLRHYEKSWPDTANSYCPRSEKMAALAMAETGFDMPASEAAAEAAVAALGAAPPPSARRQLAALFSGSGDISSALVQWLRLPPGERRAGDGVSVALAGKLDALAGRKNENYLIAAALAARLGLERVYPTDDHTADRVQVEVPPGMDDVMAAIWKRERPPLMKEGEAKEAGLKDGAGMLDLYRFYNRADVGALSVRSDMGISYAEPSPEKFGRRYVAWWETRNLHMVANVRAAMGHYPGQRALVIVGASHKPYFDAYLGMMHEVRVVPSAQVLGK